MSNLDRISYLVNRIASDSRLTPVHVSIWTALVGEWMRSNFVATFSISRRLIMNAAHVKSITTYHKVISDLQRLGYLTYMPSYHPLYGSTVKLL